MDALPDSPSHVAVIFALPIPTPATRPELFTVATEASFDSQVTGRPVSTLPAASFAIAVS
jgi:hypothetical protein